MDGKRSILLVEDEQNLASLIQLNLELEDLHVTHVDSGSKAIKIFQDKAFDLVILDVMLPEITGFEVCKMIKKNNPQIPVLFLTAKGTSQDKITGLSIGADDYMVKPFELKELLLRIQILLRRYPKSSNEFILEFRGFHINFSTYEIKTPEGKPINLSLREIQFLRFLFENKNRVISRKEILEKIWSKNENPSSRTIDNFVMEFRKIFEDNPKEPKFFHSIRGIGYKFSDAKEK
jgi:two-component system alkaline phosphatase synthesis response regulator PhoP